jgi:hypothetical protein
MEAYKRIIWYGLTGDGCGSANINWFKTKEEAQSYVIKSNDGLADIEVGRLTITLPEGKIFIKEIDGTHAENNQMGK